MKTGALIDESGSGAETTAPIPSQKCYNLFCVQCKRDLAPLAVILPAAPASLCVASNSPLGGVCPGFRKIGSGFRAKARVESENDSTPGPRKRSRLWPGRGDFCLLGLHALGSPA